LRGPLACGTVVSLLAGGFAPSAHAQEVPQPQQAQFTNINYFNAPPTGPYLTAPLLLEGNIKLLGALVLHPHFGVAEGVTDNVFRLSQPFGRRERDSITTYAPGVQAQLPFLGRHRLIVNYMANIERHSRFHQDNIEDQDRTAYLLLDFPRGLTVKGLAQWKDGHDPRGSAVATAGPGSEPNKWFTSTYGGEAQLASQAFARLRFTSTRWEFIGVNAGSRDGSGTGDINTRNRLENYSALALGGRVAPKTFLFVEGSVAQAIYEINKPLDSATYTGVVGYKWEVTGKTKGELKVGWLEKTFDRASPGGSGHFNGLTVDGNISWQPQEQTRVTLLLYRQTNETAFAETRFFVSTGATVILTHAFTRKWRATGLLGYNHDRYSNPVFSNLDGKTVTRDDNYVTAGVGLWYQVQPWLGMRVTYTYTERLSNLDSVQYNANTAMISAQAQF